MEHEEDITQIPEDGGFGQFTDKYFNVDAFTNQTTVGATSAQVTRFDLADQAAVLRDYTLILKRWQMKNWSWVNVPGFIPVEYTTDLTHEVTFVEFTENQHPEVAPMEVPPRYITLSRRTVIETSRNFNLGFPFNNRQMATPAGQEEFAMFSARITQLFTELVARMSLVKLFRPHPLDDYFYNPSDNAMSLPQILDCLADEKDVAFCGNASKFGAFPIIYEKARQMDFINPDGGWPNKVLFNPSKNTLFKFEVDPETRPPGFMMSADGVQTMFGMEFRAVPIFTQSQTKQDTDVGSLLATRVEFGNTVPCRWDLLNYDKDKISIASQGVRSVYSENADGPVDKSYVDLNRNDSRWDPETGFLHDNHKGIEKDMYTYLDVETRDWVPCRVVGDMKPDSNDGTSPGLTDRALRGMVKTFTKSMDIAKLGDYIDQAINWAPGGDAANFPREQRNALLAFASRAMVTLGGTKNPLFRGYTPEQGDRPRWAFARIMRSIFKTELHEDFFPQGAPGHPAVPDRQTRQAARDARLGIHGPAGRIAGRAVVQAGADEVVDGDMGFGDTSDEITGQYERPAGTNYNEIMASLDEIERLAVRVGRDSLIPKLDRFTKLLNRYFSDETESSNLSTEDFEVIKNGFQWIASDLNIGRVEKRIAFLEHYVGCLQKAGSYSAVGVSVEDVLARNGFEHANVLYAQTLGGNVWDNDWFDGMNDENVPAMDNINERFVPGTRRNPRNIYEDIESFHVKEDPRALDQDQGSTQRRRIDLPEMVGDNANISANVDRVNRMYYDPIEKAVALMVLLVPIHRDVYTEMMENDIIIPHEWVIVQHQMEYETEGVCIVQAGTEGIGRAMLSYPAAEIGSSAMEMAGMMHVAQFISVVTDHRRRWIIPHIFYRKCLGGASMEIYTPEEYEAHRLRQYFSEGYDRPSAVPVSIPVGSHVNGTLFIAGYLSETEETRPHYASYQFYGRHLGWDKFDPDTACLYQRIQTKKPNGLCFEGTWAGYTMDGRHTNIHENQGHHGQERPGDREVRQRGTKVRVTQGSNLFQS
jgi:hypothetical protein